MADYDIIGGVVSTEALEGLKLFKKEVSEIVTLMKGANLTSLASAKEIAQVDKLRASTEILVQKHKLLTERQNTQIANQQKLAAATELTSEKQRIAAEKALNAIAKQEQKEAEKAANDARRAAEKAARDNASLTKQEQREAAAFAKAEERRAIREAKEIATAQRIANAQATKAFAGSQGGVNQKTDLQAQATVMRLNATLASQYTTALQKLDAQIKLNVIDAQKYVQAGDTQNPIYLQNIANTKKLSAEYDRMAKASGANAVKTNSMYGSTFQLTQVMRELPNFAIDARIGFMALSNNLPMLAETFTAVTKEIDTLTGKEKGFKGAMKEFGKSLLSLNTIMIVASTLLVLFGDDMINFIGKLIEGENAAKDFAKSINLINKEVGDLMKGKKQAVQEFIHDYAVAFENSDKEMLKTLEERGKKEYDLNKEQLALIVSDKKNAATDIFKDYLQKAEDAYYDEVIIKKRVDAQVTAQTALTSAQNLFRAGSNTKSVKGKVSTGIFGEKDFSWDDLVARANDGSLYEATFEGLAIYGVAQSVIDELRTVNAQNKIIKNLPKLRNKSYISKVDDPKKPRAGKQFTEINVTREYYNSEEEMMRRLADLQNDITRENEEGELNSYDKRLKAAELYYKTVTAMAMGEQNVAIANELAKTSSQKGKDGRETGSEYQSAYNKYDNNVKKFGKGSPEDIKSLAELEEAKKTIAANSADAILKINDAFAKKDIDAKKKYQKEVLTVEADIFTEKVYYIEQEAALREKLQAALANQQSIGGMALGALGINDNKAFRNASNQRADKMTTIKDKLKGAKGSDRDTLEKELQAAQNEDAQANELEAIRVAEDAKASIVSDSIDTLKSLWDSYYAYLEDQIDNQLKKDTKVNDERLAQYEDETKAGLHTADELNKYKERSTAYQTSLDEEAARKKAELDKQQFLLQQAFALGQIWINFAIASTAPSNVGGILTPLLLAQAIASTALVAAQTIPAFAEGGIMDKSGKALLGDGGKRELAISPSGNFFISRDTPTLYNLERGTQILPDVNKVDLMSILALKQVMPNMGAKGDDKLMRELISTVRGQKQGNFYGLPLIRQMNMSDRYASRKRGLMN